MKTFLSTIGILSILVILFSAQNGCSNNQDVLDDLTNRHNYLNRRVDTVIDNQKVMYDKMVEIIEQSDRLEQNQILILADIDTIKAGQIVIYNEVTNFATKEETNLSFNGILKNFVKSW